MEMEENGYYVMLIGGESIQNVVDIASKWNVEGLIILGYNEEQYHNLSHRLNKKMILIDAYPKISFTRNNYISGTTAESPLFFHRLFESHPPIVIAVLLCFCNKQCFLISTGIQVFSDLIPA